ncbi:hypothetical protein AT6N2_C1689 [Agrobacterium tumefaciens]|nr:hypothetical protein AT6N2_C1689 [Agrobacterium tumefaciens]
MIGQQARENREEIKNRIGKHLLGRQHFLVTVRHAPDNERTVDEDCAQHGGEDAVTGARKAGEIRCDGGSGGEHRINDHLVFGRTLAGDIRHHRNADRAVIAHLEERQRPEMGRCPQEDDEEQNDAIKRNAARDAGPAEDGRKSAGSAADDDILWRRALQPHCINDGIKENGERKQAGREPVDRKTENDHRKSGQRQPEGERLARRDAARGNRPSSGAAHHRVDIGIVPHVERAGCTGANGDAENGDDAQNRIDVTRRQHEAGKGREDDERHDARLQQFEIIACAGFRKSGALCAQYVAIVDNGHVLSCFLQMPPETTSLAPARKTNGISGMRDASIHGSRTCPQDRYRGKPIPACASHSPHPAAIRLRLHFIKARFGFYHVRSMYHVGLLASLGQNVTRQEPCPFGKRHGSNRAVPLCQQPDCASQACAFRPAHQRMRGSCSHW